MDNEQDPALNPRREFRGVWIRASLWRRKDLSWFEKCLLAEIDSLGEACFASNGYLANMMGSTPGNVANAISRLRQTGLIRDLAFNGRVRRLVVDATVSSDPAPITQELRQPSQKSEGSIHPVVNIDTRLERSVLSDDKTEGKSSPEHSEQLSLKSQEITKAPTIAEKVKDQWNRFVPDLLPMSALTAARKDAIGRILKPRNWNLAFTLKAFQAVHESDFLCGRIAGKDWKADFAWVMQEENFIRILEGAFRNHAGAKSNQPLTASDHEKGF